jgi:hypothetical protein
VGTGFTFESLMSLTDVQLPLSSMPPQTGRKYNLSNYRDELLIIEGAGIKRHTMAEMCNVQRATITKILDKSP